jgi:hypothetical protein
MPLFFSGCNSDDDNDAQPVSVVEDGFYVVGEATAIPDLFAANADKGLMAGGINEANDQTARDGMYEKYVALEGGKAFALVLKEGKTETKYGATLTLSDPLSGDGEPAINVYKGALTEGGSLQVTESGLYHIVLDLNKDGSLSDKLILVAPVQWGVRGDMNNWGFTAFSTPTFDKTTMTYTLKDVQLQNKAGGIFKFAYSGGWKIELNTEATVKANTNLGSDGALGLKAGGADIAIEWGKFDISLTWTLEKGSLGGSFTHDVKRTGDADELPYPEELYMIGKEFGSWSWDSPSVVQMTPVHSHAGQFWCVRYFTASDTTGFKWNSKKEWGGDFANLATSTGFTVNDGNAFVATSGLYMVLVDYVADAITIEPARIYGIGDCFGSWDGATYPFTNTNTTANITTTANGELRMYAASTTTDADWWQTEFIILNGQIVYRGTGGDQERVTVSAGKTVTLDFNAGTGTIQ